VNNQCKAIDPTALRCKFPPGRQHVGGGSGGNNAAASILRDSSFTVRVVYANKNTILCVHCYGREDYIGWIVTSTNQNLGKKEKREIFKKIKAIGILFVLQAYNKSS